jgi:hypothetical protein
MLAAAVGILVSAGSSSPVWAGDTLTLRINDAAGVPGGRIAVVLRTYAPRGVGQGQVCLRAARSLAPTGAAAAAGSPLAALEEIVVFSENGDATSQATFDEIGQMALLQFASSSGSINTSDGPLAVLYFRLQPDVPPGQMFTLSLDPADTFLIGPDGQPIPVAPRSGDLVVRAPGSPFELAASGDRILPGETAVLGVETVDLFPIGSGEVGLRWDPTVAAAPPTVSMDPRHGEAFFRVEQPEPGLLVIAFDSPQGALNQVPGQLVTVYLPTSPSVPPGTRAALSLDPDQTVLLGPGGEPLPLLLSGDTLEFVGADAVFADGFESGSLGEWSLVVP